MTEQQTQYVIQLLELILAKLSSIDETLWRK